MAMNNVLKPDMIQKQLDDPAFFDIYVYDSVTSTNDLLKEMALNGCKEGTVVVAKQQTAGKGRKGRSFFSPPDSGLYISILLRPELLPADVSLLTPMSAVVAAETIEHFGKIKADIKWVNDILISGKKVCGILTEATVTPNGQKMDHVIIGIGINLFAPENGFPEELRDIAGSVLTTGNDIRGSVIADVLNRFKKYYVAFSNKEFLTGYRDRLFFLGKEIEILSLKCNEIATALDITDDCRLIVKLKNGEIKYLDSGEISIKP